MARTIGQLQRCTLDHPANAIVTLILQMQGSFQRYAGTVGET